MARKLDDTNQSNHNVNGPLFGRREYVKAGVLSTAAGAGIVGASMTGTAAAQQTIHIVGMGSLATYEVTVSGQLMDAPDTSYNAGANISGRNAEGTVLDDVHGYLFDGDLVDVRLNGEAIVFKNGERLNRRDISTR